MRSCVGCDCESWFKTSKELMTSNNGTVLSDICTVLISIGIYCAMDQVCVCYCCGMLGGDECMIVHADGNTCCSASTTVNSWSACGFYGARGCECC